VMLMSRAIRNGPDGMNLWQDCKRTTPDATVKDGSANL
jgi:hypothetical protein